MSDLRIQASTRFIAMAHRGGEGLWPSNTLYAFEQALALGVDAIELDIHATADGVLVVRHDPVVETTTNGSGQIRALTLAQIKALDAGYTWSADGGQTFPYRGLGISIPTLAEVLEAMARRLPAPPWVNIDIKPKEASVTEKLCALLNEYRLVERVVVGSFHGQQLRLFRKLCPQAATAAGVAETRLFFLLSRLHLARFYRPPAWAFQIPEMAACLHVVTPGFIRDAHKMGLYVNVWTVNEVADMRRLIIWGVDGLITDYPDRLLQLLEPGQPFINSARSHAVPGAHPGPG